MTEAGRGLSFSHGTARPLCDAATVVLTRSGAQGLEVYLLKRPAASGFMGGAWVFPGGKVDPADCALPAEALGEGHRTLCDRLGETPGRPLDADTRRGLLVAVCRELFEEAGILLARDVATQEIFSNDHPHFERVLARRAGLCSGEISLGALLRESGLCLEVSGLGYWAHWITPSAERRRFDTRFFVVALPPGQTPERELNETADARWMSLGEALEAQRGGEIFLPPPTLRTLEDMQGRGSVAALMAFMRREVPFAMMPKLLSLQEGRAVLLPWDRDYPGAEGEGLEGALPQNHPFMESPSRIVFDGQGWSSIDVRA